jgi:hypothetical protein
MQSCVCPSVSVYRPLMLAAYEIMFLSVRVSDYAYAVVCVSVCYSLCMAL